MASAASSFATLSDLLLQGLFSPATILSIR
jgi:hypothetical protein